jgi:hypothetical protein
MNAQDIHQAWHAQTPYNKNVNRAIVLTKATVGCLLTRLVLSRLPRPALAATSLAAMAVVAHLADLASIPEGWWGNPKPSESWMRKRSVTSVVMGAHLAAIIAIAGNLKPVWSGSSSTLAAAAKLSSMAGVGTFSLAAWSMMLGYLQVITISQEPISWAAWFSQKARGQ